jgi:Leucine-rich repeat (LRR) protein
MTLNPLRNPKIFGLAVDANFADVRNKNLALQNINLPPADLEIILGSQDAGATISDWRSFSRLSEPLHKTLDRFNRDGGQFSGLLADRAGTDGSMFGNLKINGSLSGNAIRYRYIKGLGTSTRTVAFADISTSRVSAWSSSDPKATNPDPAIQGEAKISYGAKLGIKSGGKLKFESQASGVTGPRLQTSLVPQVKEFASELPTHKIQAQVGGQTVTFYAMKGIPITFKGFFRSLNARVKLTGLISNIPPSWKIVETGNANRYSNYPNIISGLDSSISYRSSISKERFIQFYYTPDNIREIDIPGVNISELPAVKFQNATRLEFSYNNLRNFPDINFVAPNIQQLLLRRNPFYLSETESERKLQSTSAGSGTTTNTVLDKIPTTLRQIYIEGTFYGSITQNIFADRFQQLTVFDVGRGGGAYFHPDTADGSCQLPNVGPVVSSYNAGSNDFRGFGTSDAGNDRYNVQDLENVTSINLGGNYYLGGAWQISPLNNVIQTISMSSTGLQFPGNVANKQSLTTFNATYGRGTGSLVPGGSYVFNNCNELTSLSLYAASGISGSIFPNFTNAKLSTLDLRYTGISGGTPDGTTEVISSDTFRSATGLVNIYIDSGNLLTSPIANDALGNLQSLYYFWYRSYGRTGGSLPNFNGNPNLSRIYMDLNAFTGTPPNLAANPKIYYLDIRRNKLSGTIPAYKNLPSLYYILLSGNQLTNIGTFENLPALRYLYIQDNLIGAKIPDFSDCPRLQYIIGYNNKFTGYQTGSFANLTSVRTIDFSDNKDLPSSAINNIFKDLVTNWENSNRGGVNVNLRRCGVPSEAAQLNIKFLQEKNWSISTD